MTSLGPSLMPLLRPSPPGRTLAPVDGRPPRNPPVLLVLLLVLVAVLVKHLAHDLTQPPEREPPPDHHPRQKERQGVSHGVHAHGPFHATAAAGSDRRTAHRPARSATRHSQGSDTG